VKIDFVILADGAHVAGDKLYVLGGGWTILWAAEFPTKHTAAIAVGAMVDWQETNHRHRIEIALLSEGKQLGEPLVGGEFEVGRPPGLPIGAAQRFMLAAPVSISLEEPGLYELVVRVDGADITSSPFQAVPVDQGQQRPKE